VRSLILFFGEREEREMFKKKRFLLLVFFFIVFISLNALTEEEKQEMAVRIKKGFIAKLDSLIANNKPIISENETYSDESAIKMFGGDSRQILIFYKYMLYGDKITQKKGIYGIVRWYSNPERAKKYKQDTIFVNYRPKIIQFLYEFLDDEFPILQVAAAQSLIYMDITDSLVINKLEYYANRNNCNQWIGKMNLSLYNLPDLSTYINVFHKTEENRKRDAINALIRMAESALKRFNDKKENTIKNEIEIKKKLELNINIRDIDWDGNLSAAYCYQWWGGLYSNYNPAYINYASQRGDCANFASQCLIASYYEDLKTFLSSIQAKLCVV
jgi:hypothetical protein